MVEYNKIKVKLSDSQLNKFKSAVKNQTWVTLRMNIKMLNRNNLPHDLLLIIRQKKTKKKQKKQYIDWYKVVWSSNI